MTIPEIVEALEAQRAKHLFAGPSSEEELSRVEQAVGAPLPAPLRAFLQRLGGALLFDQHEIFGPRPVMIHDIDLVPDLLSVRDRLQRDGYRLPPFAVPVHRSEGRVHVMYLKEGEAPSGRVVALDLSASYPDLAGFFESVVLKGR